MTEHEHENGNEEPEPGAPEPGAPEPDDEELDDEERDGLQPDPPPPPPDDNAASEADMEKQFKSLEREATRHANRVSEIMGDEAQAFEPCPRCIPAIPGFIYPPSIAPVPPDVIAAVKLSMGEGGRPDYNKAPHARACDTCGGHGRVLSGSHANGQELILCPTCENGRGWIQVGDDMPARSVGVAEGATVRPIVAPEPLPDVDPWGREPSDPNYGRLPQFVVAS